MTGCLSRALAGGGPENVLVVVNGDSWASRQVANEYIRLRAIPSSNVVYLNDLPDIDTTSVDTFRERILKPVLAAIDKRGLRKQIDYVAYSTDLPCAVDVRGDLKGRKAPRVLTPVASINGLTYLHELVLKKDANYLQLNSNRYMRRPLNDQRRKRISREDLQRYRDALLLIRDKKWDKAIPIFRKLAETYPGQASLHYNLACCLARTKKLDESLAALRKAAAAGWSDAEHARQDADLEPLRKRKDFAALLKTMEENRNKTFDVQPTLAFRNRYRWNEKGEKTDTDDPRYLLSTMLAVTGGRGNSVSEAIESLRRSASADRSQPRGTIYYLVNGNIRSRTREGAFRSAAVQLKRLGVKAEILKGVLPPGKKDVMGAMIGTAAFNWAASKSTILPGAVCEHLTSFGGVMREDAGQTPLTEFLRYGAAGSSGTVTEPFAIQAKFPLAFLHVHYARGCSLAESFYQSVAGPYQLLIVGDPLCQPWAKPMTLSVTGLKAGATISGEIDIAATVKDAGGTKLKAGHFELFLDGKHVETVGLQERFKIDTRKLADGYHEARIVAVRGDAIETQSRLILPFLVNNHGRRVALSAAGTGRVAWNAKVLFKTSAKGARLITLMRNGQPIRQIYGKSGTTSIAALDLGPGPVQIVAVADIDGKPVRSRPVTLTVTPPDAWKPVQTAGREKPQAGLLLTMKGGKPAVIESTRDRRWLAKAGVKPEQTFELSGEFQVTSNGVYQIQCRSNGSVQIAIDGKPVVRRASAEKTPAWRFVPVVLQKGTHRIQLQGTAVKNPILEVRFGDRGAQSLDGKRFRHRPTKTK